MKLSNGIRLVHRWTSIIFTVTVVANFAVRAFGEPPAWLTYSPLLPLFLQLVTGLYMLVQYYALRGRAPTGA